MESFTLVSHKKSKRRHNINNKKKLVSNTAFCWKTSENSLNDGQEIIEEQNIERHVKLIKQSRNEIQASDFWSDVKGIFSSISGTRTNEVGQISAHLEEIVSYGIGNFAGSPIARYQFAFLLLLAGFLEADDNVYLYDPVLTKTERLIADRFKINLIQENEECKRKVTKRTLFVMLHCGKTMYDNLLTANWNPGIENLFIIGNTFSNYTERLPSTTLKAESPHIFDIIPYTREHEFKNSFEHKDIFNDTCLITFPPELLATLSEDFWLKERPVCKTEDDVEIVTKDKVKAFWT